MIILSAPSGAGKSTLANHLVQAVAGVQQSISTTTRKPRPGEVPGRDYHFIDQASFRAKITQGSFLEWAEVFGNYYGTAKERVEPALQSGVSLLLDIDWQGAQQIRKSMPPKEVVSIFILPPSREILQQRLCGRKTDDPQVIAQRMAEAEEQLSHWKEYDYLLINNNLTQAQDDLVSIVVAERLRRERSEEAVQQIVSTFTE